MISRDIKFPFPFKCFCDVGPLTVMTRSCYAFVALVTQNMDGLVLAPGWMMLISCIMDEMIHTLIYCQEFKFHYKFNIFLL